MEEYQEYRNNLAKEIKRCRFNKQKIRLARIQDEELNSDEYKDAKKKHLDSKTRHSIDNSQEQVSNLLGTKSIVPQSIGEYNREDFPFSHESDEEWELFVENWRREQEGKGFFSTGLIVRRKEKKARRKLQGVKQTKN